MIVYLAGIETSFPLLKPYCSEDTFLLSSFFAHSKAKQIPEYCFRKNHILDSGVFSLFGGTKQVDLIQYTKKYCQFINETDKRLFFEMDIDKLTSLGYVEDLRKRIEDSTGKRTIPVWHKSRGIEYYYKMCEEYDYIAISASGMFESKWTRDNRALPILRKLITIAHSKGTKVHGLGYTVTSKLHSIHFDSVDSTTWLMGAKYGMVYYFNGSIMVQNDKGKFFGKNESKYRIKNSQAKVFNFNEWRKFQNYALENL